MRKAPFIFVLCVCCTLSLQAQVIGTYQPAYWPNPGANSIFLTKDTGMSASFAGGCVEPYTGQHSEDFELFSMQGRGGLSYSLSLHYYGAVKEVVTEQNYRLQASPFGVGFNIVSSIGVECIHADHRGTASIWDDNYHVVIGGSAVELKPVPNQTDEYVLADGRAWRVLRHRWHDPLIPNPKIYDVVIGFEIITENGTILQMGDLHNDASSWNSTQSIARFGRDLRPGQARADSVEEYAFEWYLKRAHDAEDLNMIEFTYLRDRYLIGREIDANQLNTRKYATRATYLQEVRSADGQKIVLSYEDRDDVQPDHFALAFEGGVTRSTFLYDLYQSKRIDHITLVSRTDVPISKYDFEMGYLTFGIDNNAQLQRYGDRHSKLILKTLQFKAGDETVATPPYRFEYYEDSLATSVGSLRRIIYPSSEIKELTYRYVADDSNFTNLDSPMDFGQWFMVDQLHGTVSENLFLGAHSSTSFDLPMQGMYWDAYWRDIEFEAEKDQFQFKALPWNDNWYAYFKSDDAASSIRIRRWRGGYWDEEIIPYALAPDRAVTLYPDRDGFLLELWKPVGVEVNAFEYKYYRWNGEIWTGFAVKTFGGGGVVARAIKVQDGVIAISYTEGIPSESYVICAKYDASLDDVVVYGPSAITPSYVVTDSMISVGTDMACWLTGTKAKVLRYNDTLSQWMQVYESPEYDQTYGIAVSPQAVTWSYRDHLSYHLVTGQFTDTIDHLAISDIVDTRVGPHRLTATNHTLHFEVGLYEWLGDRWGNPFTFTELWHREATVYPGSARFKGSAVNDPRSHTRPWVYLGKGDWWSGGSMDDTLSCASEGLFVFDRNTASAQLGRNLYVWDPFFMADDAGGSPQLRDLGQIGDYQLNGQYGSSAIVGSTISVISSVGYPSGPPSLHLYKYVDRKYVGKASLVVVDTVKLLQFVGDANPIVQTYAYSAGLINQAANSPRFGKVAVSVPHYVDQSDTLAFVELHYYNDIDSTSFYDADIYQDGTWFPELDDELRYGIENGGYSLDGSLYLTDSYILQKDGVEVTKLFERDSVRYAYQLCAITGGPADVYRTQLRQVESQQDRVSSVAKYRYHPVSGLVVSVWTQDGPGLWLVDSLAYAADRNVTMSNDHAWSQVESRSTYHWSATAPYVLLDSSHSVYVKKGTWQIERTELRDVEASITVTPYQAVTFDEVGNVTCTKNGRNIHATTKYDDQLFRTIATVSGGRAHDCLLLDFEQALEWDGWDITPSDFQGVRDDIAYTGMKSYGIADDPSSTEINHGPTHDVASSDLTDTLYQFSLWARGNHSVTVKCLCYADASGTTLCSAGEKSVTFSLVDPDQWSRLEGTFNISAQMACLHHVRFEVCFENTTPYDAGKFALLDNIRIHPASALVTTTVYDPVTYSITAQLDANNVPTTYSYDKLLRYRASHDYLGRHLDSAAYHFKADSLMPYSLWYCEKRYEDAFHADTLLVTSNMSCDYYYSAVEQGTGWLFKNDADPFGEGVIMMASNFSSTTPKYATGSFTVVPGDKLIFKYGTSNQQSFAKIDVVSRPSAYPATIVTPNYTWSSRHSTESDSSQTVSFSDERGHVIQTRMLFFESLALTRSVVSVSTYDAQGRLTNAYKPYSDVDVPVKAFDPNFASKVADYYDGTPGVNCGAFPFTTHEYEHGVTSRLTKVLSPGAVFRDHGVMYNYGSNSSEFQGSLADSLYQRLTTNENGSVHATYLDKSGHIVGTVLDTLLSSSAAQLRIHTQFVRNARGQDTLIYQPNGQQIRSGYNSLGQLAFKSSGDFGEVRYLYDEAGNLRFVRTASDFLASPSRFHYFKYDAHDRVIETGIVRDATKFTRANAQDDIFPLSRGADAGICAITTESFYDTAPYGRGRLAKSISYHCSSTRADSASWEAYEYDPVGRFVKSSQFIFGIDQTTPRIFQASYNLAGQMSNMTYPNGQSILYYWGISGNLDSIRGSSNQLALNYTYWPDGSMRTKSFGRLASQVVDYDYNSRGWLREINETQGYNDRYRLRLSYESDAYKGIGVETDPITHDSTFPYAGGYYNGNVSQYSLQINSTPTVIQKDYSFAYDGADRLMAVDDETWGIREFYDFDENGNFLAIRPGAPNAIPSQTYNYYASTNRVSEVVGLIPGTNAISYTPSGSTLQLGVNQSLRYNLTEQLSRRFSPGVRPNYSDNLYFQYNAGGQRIRKHLSYWHSYPCEIDPPPPPIELLMGGSLPEDSGLVYQQQVDTLEQQSSSSSGGGSTTCYSNLNVNTGYYYFGGQMVADYKGSSSSDLLYNYVYANGERVAHFKNVDNDIRYYLNDHLGSVVATIDRSNVLRNKYTYSPWGATQNAVIADAERFNYTGQERDEELFKDLLYYGARYYDASLRRFLSVDPASAKFQAWSPYVYCINNPFGFKDPDGSEPVKQQLGGATELRKALAGHILGAASKTNWLLRTSAADRTPMANPVANAEGRYVGLKDGTVIDMQHFMAAANEVVTSMQFGQSFPESRDVVLLSGFLYEVGQAFKGQFLGDSDAGHSAFSSEDMVSNAFGAEFASVYDPTKPLGDQIVAFLMEKGLIDAGTYKEQNKDEYDSWPSNEDEAQSRYNAAQKAKQGKANKTADDWWEWPKF